MATLRGSLYTDICLVLSCEMFEWQHGRKITVKELSSDAMIALGKKVFEYLGHRDRHYPHITDEYVYCGCLSDHNIERSRPDGIDIKNKFNRLKKVFPNTYRDLLTC